MLARWTTNAISKIPLKPWGYHRCVRAAFQIPSRHIASFMPQSGDDLALKALFDEPGPAQRSSPLSPTGLFGHSLIDRPEGLITFAHATLFRAQQLTERVLRAPESRDELLKVVKNLDRLSDMLCGVIDLAELVRNAHPDENWVNAANQAYESLCEFMNVLNTHVGLYSVRLHPETLVSIFVLISSRF